MRILAIFAAMLGLAPTSVPGEESASSPESFARTRADQCVAYAGEFKLVRSRTVEGELYAQSTCLGDRGEVPLSLGLIDEKGVMTALRGSPASRDPLAEENERETAQARALAQIAASEKALEEAAQLRRAINALPDDDVTNTRPRSGRISAMAAVVWACPLENWRLRQDDGCDPIDTGTRVTIYERPVRPEYPHGPFALISYEHKGENKQQYGQDLNVTPDGEPEPSVEELLERARRRGGRLA